MQANDIAFSEKQNYTFSANTYAPRRHYKFIMSLGRCFPTTKAQAIYFLQQGAPLDVLNSRDVEVVEALLNKHGFKGAYRYTKSRSWVRLQNTAHLCESLKKEYAL